MLKNIIGISLIALLIYIKVKYLTLVGFSLILYYFLVLAIASGFFGDQMMSVLSNVNERINTFLLNAKAEYERGKVASTS